MGYPAAETENEIILKYIPLVKRIVNRIDSGDGYLEKDDLFSVGVIGLMDAVKKYDSDKSVPFEAYASVRIKGSIIDEMRKSGRVSRDRINKLNRFYRAREDLEQKLLRKPEEHEICMELGITQKDLYKLHETVHYLSEVSMETTLFTGDGSEIQLLDMIKDESMQSPEMNYLEKERKSLLIEAIEQLNEREKIILSLYYVEELTLKEIAYILDISIPRVSQIHGKILVRLKDFMS
ncbi:FliA/WhiG family RNA polymerase sigma factor [Alkalibacter sp. M17DMB]|nr:FliA/WhiG family RNA polymerase sigma factor [Alkalibacter mobilis]MBF7096302.1 FliA/WhiG family RNA polymerase sigma factor [Alkalibacter mobilis]